ncbi:MAG: helix-turn-helix domain-containing protein [Candidatus Hodarchaeota archaeon]
MSNNQMMNIVEGRTQFPSRLKSRDERGKPTIVKELDRKILKILRKEGPLTRPRLMSITGIPRSTLYDGLWRLILKGYVVSYSENRKLRGRPRTYFAAVQQE